MVIRVLSSCLRRTKLARQDEHVLGKGDAYPSAGRQIDYWSEGLGVKIGPNVIGITSAGSRGEILVETGVKVDY